MAPPAGGGNIKVVVRCRPFNSREIDRHAKCVVEMKENQTVITPPPDYQHVGKGAKDHGAKVFAFDRSYWSFARDAQNYAAQSNLFDDLGRPLLDNAFQGYNNCIFAYGQTGSGKSYSMMGYGKEHGIIPNICQDMFRRIETMQADKTLKCTVEVSYLEIYNERVRDLLNPATKGNLKVREHPSTGPYVEDLAKLVVGSFQEIENLMDEGNKARTVAATNMNQTSSRSHAVFTLMLTQKKFDTETKMAMEKVAKISLVDLAGSERATSTGATGARLKEGAEINRSLSTLGRVISALAESSSGKKKKGGTQVPYRDSVLTWLLKDSLGGNSMTAMIAAISPADINFDETLSTLRYADSAKRIKNHAVINEDANARMIRELKEELAQLRSKLGGGGAGSLTSPGGSIAKQMNIDPSLPPEKQMIGIAQPDGSVKEVSRAEITERLTQNEKLLEELNQTWEQKLQRTEEIQKEREASLEELGVSIDKAQGYMGISTPKNTPHLVNLSDDPLLAESLVYLLRPGTTVVCNARSSPNEPHNEVEPRHIKMNGSKIMPEHCSFDHAADGSVTLIPNEGASIMVNGKPITEPKKLNSGNRIILGDFHIYRFNHPAQVRAERAEARNEQRDSLLRQSITVNQLQALERISPTPSPRPMGHERSWSRADSDIGESRPDSPAPSRNGRDSEWALARREAAPALLGLQGQTFAKLTDEALDALYEDVARAREARAERREEGDEDGDSVSSLPVRDKYMSTGTIDNFSLDTAFTGPSTPKQTEEERRAEQEQIHEQIGKAREEILAAKELEMEAIRQEYKAKLDDMDPLKKPRPKGNPVLSLREREIGMGVVKFWRGRRYVNMAESVLQHASTLKEAQIMSHELDEHVIFQFTVVDAGHAMCSTYDMILKDLDDNDDIALEEARKPCIGVRVIDFRHELIHVWSLEKLHERVRLMRQMHQYLDQPEYLQHLSLDNPFLESSMPRYSLVGEVDVPLQAVFDSRVQDFTLDVVSPYNTHVVGILKLSLEPSSARAPNNTLKFNAVLGQMAGFAEREGTEVHALLYIPGASEEGGSGCLSTQMITDFDESPIHFDSVHSMTVPLLGAPDLHMRIAVFAKVTNIHLDKLLSWDGMRDSVVHDKPKAARIAESQFYTEEKHDILARIQLLEPQTDGEYRPVDVVQANDLDAGVFQLRQGIQSRIALNLSHSSGDGLPWDEVGRVRVGKIQLVDPSGKTPDMTATPDVDLRCSKPTFKEHANGTRSVTLSAGWHAGDHESLLLLRVTAERYRVQIIVSWEVNSPKLAEPMRFSAPVHLQIVPLTYQRQQSVIGGFFKTARFVHSTSRMFTLTLKPAPLKRVGELWRMDSQHDYVKGEEMLAAWAPRGVSLVRDFIAAKMRRARANEIAGSQRVFRKIGLPEPRARLVDDDIPLPRLPDDDEDDILEDTPEPSQQSEPEEEPSEEDLADPPLPPEPGLTQKEKRLLTKIMDLWQGHRDPIYRILRPSNTEPPHNGVAPEPPAPPALLATIVPVSKHPKVMKCGYLLVPNSDSTRWVKRWVELRRPYLHIYTVKDKEELAIISLRNSQIDSQPSVLAMLHGPGGDYDIPDDQASEVYRPHTNGAAAATNGNAQRGSTLSGLVSSLWSANTDGQRGESAPRLSERVLGGVFAIYGKDNTWLLAAPTAEAKSAWITKIDQSWTMSPGSSIASTPNMRDLASRAASPLPGSVRNVFGLD
ncbi:kinesin-II 85 kDa subunit [Zalerion maritima]|uniref:Kinesin-II 85 kDa subunit n=1 Tax=Zalerion maritima TaxID=339359 RepID=A0AAD5WR97_9PEZI|nr:kinesin-II 85 kDa subunit [Zalerion maritima]